MTADVEKRQKAASGRPFFVLPRHSVRNYTPFYTQAANLWEFSAYGKSGHNYFSILFACANSGA